MSLTEHLMVLISGEGAGLIKEFEKIGGSASKAYADTQKGASAASKETQNLGGVSGFLNTKLQSLGVSSNISGLALKTAVAGGAVAAGAAMLKFGEEGVKAFVETTGEVRAFQRVSGATAEDSSKLVASMHVLGIESEAGATSVFRLARNIATHADKLKADNIEIAKNKEGNTDIVSTLMNVADAYNATQDPAQKAKIVFDAFGRSGANMIPILQRGREGLKELFDQADRHHEIFSQAELEKGRQFKLATVELGQAFKGLEIEVGSALVPALTGLAHGMTTVIEEADSAAHSITDFAKSVPGGSSFLHSLVDAANPLPGILDALGASHHKAGDAAKDQASKDRDLAQATDAASQAQDAEAKAIDNVISSSISAISSTLGLERAHDTESRAVGDYTEKLRIATTEGGRNAQANDALGIAAMDAKDSIVNEANAAVKLAQDQATATGQTLTGEQAAHIFHDRMIGLADQIGGPLHDQLINLANTIIYSVPDAKNINITADTGMAIGQLQALANQLGVTADAAARFHNYMAPGYAHAAFPWAFAEGGIVTSAKLALVGEAGPEAIIPLSKPNRAAEILSQMGAVKPFGNSNAAIGAVGSRSGGPVVVVHVAGSVISENDLAERVRRVLYRTNNRNSY